MKHEFYVKTTKETVINLSADAVNDIRKRYEMSKYTSILNNYNNIHYCKDFRSRLKWLENRKDNILIGRLINVRMVDVGYKLIKFMDNIMQGELKKGDMVDIGGHRYNIKDVAYDIDNNVVKYYFSEECVIEEISEDKMDELKAQVKEDFDKRMNYLIEDERKMVDAIEWNEINNREKGLLQRFFNFLSR